MPAAVVVAEVPVEVLSAPLAQSDRFVYFNQFAPLRLDAAPGQLQLLTQIQRQAVFGLCTP